MRLLLDENLPKKLKGDFPGHEVFTINDRGWNGLKNGVLMQKLVDNKFNALMTYDMVFQIKFCGKSPALRVAAKRSEKR